MFSLVSLVAAPLGWRFRVPEIQAQLILFPEDRSLHLRFCYGLPVAMPPDPPTLLLDFDVSAETAVSQIMNVLIELYQALPQGQAPLNP